MTDENREDLYSQSNSEIRSADYYKLRCESCSKKTIVIVVQNMPLGIWVNLHFCYLYFMLVI